MDRATFHAERYAAWTAITREAIRLCHRHRYVHGTKGSLRESTTLVVVATDAVLSKAQAERLAIMAQTGHRSADMVRRYIREGNLWRENAASLAGL